MIWDILEFLFKEGLYIINIVLNLMIGYYLGQVDRDNKNTWLLFIKDDYRLLTRICYTNILLFCLIIYFLA